MPPSGADPPAAANGRTSGQVEVDLDHRLLGSLTPCPSDRAGYASVQSVRMVLSRSQDAPV